MYTSISFDMGNASQPEAPSALCLVCHNGIASELVNYPGPCSNPDSAYDFQIAGCADLGKDLSDDHPLSFKYNKESDQDNNEFPVINTVNGRIHLDSAQDSTVRYFLYKHADGFNNYFECATCHSVHDLADYPGKGEYQVYFLRADNTGSAMCLDCHTKR